MKRFNEVADKDMKGCILVSLSSSRTEPAIGFLLDLMRTGSRMASEAAKEALAIHRGDARIQQAIEEAVGGRDYSA